MILVATLALGDGRRSRWSAWLAFLVGVAASLAANVLAAAPDATARVVSAWPAVALLLTVEVLARAGRAPASATATPSGTATAAPVPVASATDARATGEPPTAARPLVMATVDPGPRADVGRDSVATPEAAPVAEVPPAGEVTADHGHRPRPTSRRPRRKAPATGTTDALAVKVAAIVATNPTATAEDVAAEIDRAPRTARRYLATARAALATAATATA